jgi:hypothetical protein
VAEQDASAMVAMAQDPDLLEAEPALAGLAVRAMRATQPGDRGDVPALQPAFRDRVLQTARCLPCWPDIAATTAATVPEAPESIDKRDMTSGTGTKVNAL